MNIIETNLQFGELSSRSVTDMIVLHHAAATTCSAQDIHAWHLANGWSGAGYHFLVRKDGSIYRLRPEWTVGAHAVGVNYRSIGICAEGDFNKEYMPEAQQRAIGSLLHYLVNQYPIYEVTTHRMVGNTDCPGENYPFENIIRYSNEEENKMSDAEIMEKVKAQIAVVNPVYKDLDDVPSWYRPAVKWCVDQDYLQGDGTGLNITEEMCRMCTVMYRFAQDVT